MFNIYQSHSLEELAQYFGEIYEPDNTDPFQPTWVVVQNNEIKEWLSLKLAEENEIAGNFRFIFPSEFLWKLYRLIDDDIPEVLPSDLNAMQWALFDLLSNKPELLSQIPYYTPDTDTPIKRVQLCAQLADNFDQYQVYRPQMMEAWLKRRLVTKHKDEKWQANIWKELNEKWNFDRSTENIPSRSKAFTTLLSCIDRGVIKDKLPGQIYLFGLSQASKPFLEIILRLSGQVHVHYFKNESKIGLEDSSEVVKELILDWRKPALEQQNLLQQIAEQNGIPINHKLIGTPEPKRRSQLFVHSCHSKRREVQVLKDQLLKYLDENPDCDLSEILVMIPDAEDYGSLIEVVFGNDEGEPFLPVTRLSNNRQESAEYALNVLLDLISSSYKTSEILQLLNLEPIKRSFSLSDDEIDVIEDWILDNKVFRGLGDQYNATYSWQKALNQMIAGFSMEPDDLSVYNGLIPYHEIASSEDMLLAARFSEFIHALLRTEKSARQNKTPSDWLGFIERILTNFMGSRHEENQTSRIFQKISKLKKQVDFTNTKEKLSYNTIRHWLKRQFDTTSSASGRFGQGVTVSSYVPYRSVPFRFIAVLGMNEGVFPRKAVRPEFDLIYADPQPGDRIQKEDDTYLFLETILATKDHLHVSYKGQDQRTDSKLLPSILIQQYLDSIQNNWEEGITYHHLFPFNTHYFNTEKYKFSYSGLNLKLAREMNKASEDKVFMEPSTEIPEESKNEKINISDIISFFTKPSKYLLYNELGLSNYSNFNQINDREMFKLNGLERYELDDLLFQKLVRGKSEKKVYDFVQNAGMIPDQLQGKKTFDQEVEKIHDLIIIVEQHTSGEEHEEEISIQLGGAELFGTISGIYNDVLVSYRVGSRRAKHEVQHWLKHLLLLENNTDISRSLFVSKDNDGIKLLHIESKDIPSDLVQGLLKWYQESSFLKKAAFFPETSRTYTEAFHKNHDNEKAMDGAYKKWEYHKKYNKYAESNDYFNALLWRNIDPLSMEAFIQHALEFWSPLLEAMEEEEL